MGQSQQREHEARNTKQGCGFAVFEWWVTGGTGKTSADEWMDRKNMYMT